MKSLRSSTVIKTVAFILMFIILAVVTVSASTTVYLYSNNYYFDSGVGNTNARYSTAAKKMLIDIFDEDMFTLDAATGAYHFDNDIWNSHKDLYTENRTNLSFNLVDIDGNVVAQNYKANEYSYSSKCTVFEQVSDNVTSRFTAIYFISDPLSVKDEFYFTKIFTKLLDEAKISIIGVFIISSILSLVLCLFLIYSTGRHRDEQGKEYIRLNFIDKIPIDLYFLLALLLFIFCFVFFLPLGYALGTSFWSDVFTSYLRVVIIFVTLMSVARRAKCGKVFDNAYIIRSETPRHALEMITDFLNSLPLIWQAILVIVVLTLIEFIFLVTNSFTVFWIFEKIVTIPVMLLLIINMRTIIEGEKKIADGDINHKIDTRYLLWSFREYAERLNGISDIMQGVVDDRMTIERRRTEMITNVSHDIKTPLTSIVTYVDLLKHEDIGDDAKHYVDVIGKQADKMTKLITDLVDASKASSGAVSVNVEEIDASTMLEQAVTEYDERLRAASLIPVLELPDNSSNIMADGALLWRVFDNLLSNICKYSMENTRVYFTVSQTADDVSVAFKNISKYPIDVSGDELTERFVRGDRARQSEGSGLGLSIAQSLITLQKGRFNVSTDGDLFKVTVTFDKSK